MNVIAGVNEMQDRIEETGRLLDNLKADIRMGASGVDLTEVVDDIAYQAVQIEQLAHGLERNLR